MQDQEGKITNDLTPKDVEGTYQNMDNQENVDYRYTKEKPSKSISELSEDIYQTNVEKGFWDNSTNIIRKLEGSDVLNKAEVEYIKNAFSSMRLMLIVSEAAEAMEAIRTGKRYAGTPMLDKFFADGYTPENSPDTFVHLFEKEVKDTYPDELSDLSVRNMDLSKGEGIDLEKHIALKLAYNKTRSRMHGGKQF